MQTSIEIITAIAMLIVGVSHVTQPRAWVEFFTIAREKGHAGVIAVGMLHLPTAMVIVATHRIWHGVPIIVTLLGFAWLLKAALYMTMPSIGMKSLQRVSIARRHEFVWAGLVLIALAVVIATLAGIARPS